MIKQVILNEKQRKEIIYAAEACNLSVSAFLRMAAKEKINRMGIQTNTSQGTNLDSPSTTNTTRNGADANDKRYSNNK